MARTYFAAEKALRIYKENSQTAFIDIIFDAGAPAGTSGETDAAPIGSIYCNSTDGGIWKKIANTSSASDWSELGDVTIDELHWRNEKVRAATVDTLSAGIVDPTGFSDNESGLDGNDFAVGEYIIGDVDGTPALFEVTTVTSATSITIAAASLPLADNDTFVVQVYLPDSPGSQELQAIIHFPLASGPGVKIGDINWNFADGIGLAAGYTPGSGDISSADTVQSAIEKLDGNNDDQDSVLGTAQGDTNLGSFPGFGAILLTATESVKSAIQKISDFLGGLRKVTVSAITAATTVDEVLVDNVQSCKWLVVAFEDATPANKQAIEVYAVHNGTAGADANASDDTQYAKLKLGANFDLSLSVDLNGTGAAQTMRLRAASGSAGVTVTARRIEV